jgi:hypothetical protein
MNKEQSAAIDGKQMLAASAVKVEQYVYEKVKKSDVEIQIPNEPIFFQAHNYRVVTGVFPQFAKWDNGRVWELQIVQVKEDEIVQAFVRTSPKELSDIISRFEIKNKGRQDYLVDEVVRYLRDYFTDDRISKQTFVSKYNERLSKIAEIIGL